MSAVTRLPAGQGAGPSAPILLVDEFLPPELAVAMREDIDAHFAEPGAHRPDIHQVWNYWFVPEHYTYLRTTPEKVIHRERVDSFVEALRVIVQRAELTPRRSKPDPVVLSGITLAPRHGVPVRVASVQPLEQVLDDARGGAPDEVAVDGVGGGLERDSLAH